MITQINLYIFIYRMAEIRRKFVEYDVDGNGQVSVEEAHDILRRELAFTPEQSIQLVKRYDKNGDGQLSYEEFVKFYFKVKSKYDFKLLTEKFIDMFLKAVTSDQLNNIFVKILSEIFLFRMCILKSSSRLLEIEQCFCFSGHHRSKICSKNLTRMVQAQCRWKKQNSCSESSTFQMKRQKLW